MASHHNYPGGYVEVVDEPIRNDDAIDIARNLGTLATWACKLCMNGPDVPDPAEMVMVNTLYVMIQKLLSYEFSPAYTEIIKLEIPSYEWLESYRVISTDRIPSYSLKSLDEAAEYMGRDFAANYGFKFYYFKLICDGLAPEEQYSYFASGRLCTGTRACRPKLR